MRFVNIFANISVLIYAFLICLPCLQASSSTLPDEFYDQKKKKIYVTAHNFAQLREIDRSHLSKVSCLRVIGDVDLSQVFKIFERINRVQFVNRHIDLRQIQSVLGRLDSLHFDNCTIQGLELLDALTRSKPISLSFKNCEKFGDIELATVARLKRVIRELIVLNCDATDMGFRGFSSKDLSQLNKFSTDVSGPAVIKLLHLANQAEIVHLHRCVPSPELYAAISTSVTDLYLESDSRPKIDPCLYSILFKRLLKLQHLTCIRQNLTDECLNMISPYLVGIVLRNDVLYTSNVTNAGIERFLGTHRRLQVFEIYDYRRVDPATVIGSLPDNLLRFGYTASHPGEYKEKRRFPFNSVSEEKFISFLDRNPNLQKLSLGIHLQNISLAFAHLPQTLTTLSLIGMDDVGDSDLDSFPSLIELTSLHLERIPNISCDSAATLVRHTPQLRKFRLHRVLSTNFNALREILETCLHLRLVEIINEDSDPFQVAKYLGSTRTKLPSLEEALIFKTKTGTQSHTDQIVQGQTRLRTITL